MSHAIDLLITRETEDESKDLQVTVSYEENAGGIIADRFAVTKDGTIIALTETEHDIAMDKAWNDWGEEQVR